MHEIGVREAVQFAGFTFNSQTLVMTWISMVVVLFIGWLAVRNLKVVPTSNWQVMMETVIEALHDQVEENMGPRGRGFHVYRVAVPVPSRVELDWSYSDDGIADK